MFEELWENSPTIQRMRKQYLMEGIQEGRKEGLWALQRSLVNVVRVRYPELATFAQQQVSHLDKTDTLELLIERVTAAPNADAVRKLLESGTVK
jgi:hypothetical protein